MNDNGKNGNTHSHPSNAKIDGIVLPPKESTTVARHIDENDDQDSSGDDLSSGDETEDDVMLQALSGDALPMADRDAIVVTVEKIFSV